VDKNEQNKQDVLVAKEFDRQAKRYDKSYTVNTYQRKTQIMVIDQIEIKQGMNILDLGCGTGSGTIDIASKLDGTGNVIGIDLSEKMIEQAKNKINTIDYTNIEFILGSGNKLAYDNYFDYVISTNAYHHFKNKNQIFLNVYNSLKRNGVFILQDICNDFIVMKMVDLAGKIGERAHIGSTTSDTLKHIFSSTGFDKINIEKIKLNWFWRIMIGKGIKKGIA
jgi:ubiquinone/menaquinone biosynthesis C-methylase UbiE